MIKPMIRAALRTVPAAAGLLFTLALAAPAGAAELQALAWEESATPPTLRIELRGEASYRSESLDGGQRLRIVFAGTGLAQGVTDLAGRSPVKGVFPYLAEGGDAAHVDLLLTEPGELKVEKTDTGYRVQALLTAEGASAVAAPAEVAVAAQDGRNVIEDIGHTVLPGDRLKIRIKLARPPQLPNAFTITNPPRISLDFPDTRLGLAKKALKIGEGAVISLNAIESEMRARVVLNLVKPAGYSTAIEGNELVLTVENPVTAIAGTQAPPTTTQFAAATKPGRHSIRHIDFHRGPQGDAKLTVKLSDTGTGIVIREQAGEIIVDFQDTRVAPELQKRLNVVDFATPVQTVDTFSQGNNTRIVIAASGKYEHLAYQAGELFTVNVKPVTEKIGEKKADEFGYSGEKLSLNFQNIDVRAALQVIADFTGLNIVTSDTVKGSLTLRLKDVPWDQALDIILNAKGLAKREKGNVIAIAPAEEVVAKEKAVLEAGKQVLELEPLVSELIQVNYAKAEDIAKLLKSIKAVETGIQGHPVFGGVTVQKLETESNTLLSPRGQVTVDARTNSLLIQDTPAKIREVRKLIALLDQPVRQVMIETRLVEATDDFSRSLGVRFGTQASRVSDGVQSSVGGSLTDPTALNVNLPAAAPSGVTGISPGSLALTIARLGTGDLLNLELSALEIEGRGKIISSPRLITANQKKARIEQGQERVFTTSVLGVGSTITKKAVLALDVTPQITPDDRVILDVIVTKDSFADAAAGLINKKEITTQVLLDNGETVVIGGIYEQSVLNTTNKIPFLGDLPLLGWMFRQNIRSDNKVELLIFLTPRILSETLSLR